MLTPYRVLDLTDDLGFLCGKVLGDLGADVIKVEPPGGDPARRTGPFFGGAPDPEKSLYWFAYNNNKRGITLDLTGQRELFLRLVRTADFLLESFPPGHLAALGLACADLHRINPGLIHVSITPFGQSGPYSRFLATDLEIMALGGAMSLAGERDGPPLRVSVPQAPMWVGAEAAMGALVALYHRAATGEGQQVDVSAQAAVLSSLAHAPAFWDLNRVNPLREGVFLSGRSVTGARMRLFWPCRDGWLNFALYGGPAGIRTVEGLVAWMDERGGAPPLFKAKDWRRFDPTRVTQDEVDALEAHIGAFFQQLTKAEFLAGVTAREMLGYPVSTPADIAADDQLAAREFWQEVEHPELGVVIRYPGAFARFGSCQCRIRRRAPHVGEHNGEILAALEAPAHAPPRALAGTPRQALAGKPPQALAGLKVVEFGAYAAGPYIGKHLANYGATVVHVESRQRPDGFRMQYPPYKDNVVGVNRSGCFAIFNDSKYAITLNLKAEGGVELAHRLTGWADVVIENMTPGTMTRLGLGYADLAALNPGLVMLSTCNMGQTGPRAQHPGFGTQLSALSGFTHLTGQPDGPPQLLYGPYIDFVAVAFGGIAVLAALDQRRRTGRGDYIDLAQYETGVQFLAAAVLDYNANGHEATRQGNRSPEAAPHGAYPCLSHMWIALSCWSDEEWVRLCGVAGHPGWAADARFATASARQAHTDHLDALLGTWTAEQDAWQLLARLQQAGVHAGVVNTMRDLFTDPQLRWRHIWQQQVHPDIGVHHYHMVSYDLNDTPGSVTGPAPCLGQHNAYVYQELLRLSAAEYEQLCAAGVID